MLIGSVFLVAALLMVSVGGYVYVTYRFGQVRKVTAKHLQAAPPEGQPFNVLLIGSDSRAFVSNSQQAQSFGTQSDSAGQRSDVTMVARVVPATKQVTIMSIPRDLWVTIPGDVSGVSGPNRINTAYDSGPDLLIQTVEQDLGIPINHFAAVNFPGFQQMVDSLGGIKLDFPMPVEDQYTGLNIQSTGCQLVDGAQALALVRSRHLSYYENGQWNYDGLSDFSRIRRQDAFFRALLAKVNSNLTDPIALNGFVGAAVHNLTVDSSVTAGFLLNLATEFHGLPQENLQTETLPTVPYTTDGGAQVLQLAQPYAQQMISQFLSLGTSPATSSSTSAATSSSTSTSTTTTYPAASTSTASGAASSEGSSTDGSPATPASDVITNTQPEPWNPVPCGS